jgi:YfiH family protein
VLETVDPVQPFAAIGVRAFTTTRATGDFAVPLDGITPAARSQWEGLLAALGPGVTRLASSLQVHGRAVAEHGEPWEGWQRLQGLDGHVSRLPGTALAVSVADCIPVFLAHRSGMVGVLHAGWRGVAGRILEVGLARFAAAGCPTNEVYVHFGPGISGRAYEVGPDVYEQLTGWETQRPRQVDLRGLLMEQAREAGVRQATASAHCTVEDGGLFYSHRQGDAQRQVAVIVVPGAGAVGLP